jgi:hypothetical protein
MKLLSFKKSIEILLLAAGFFLLIMSLTWLNKPFASQGVQAMEPVQYQTYNR